MVKRYTLSKPQRAAAVLVAMGKSRASQLLKFFKSNELRVMIDAAHTLKSIPQPDLEELVKEFESEFAVGAGLIDSAEAMNKILSEGLSDEEMFALTGTAPETDEVDPTETIWERVAKVERGDLVTFFTNESPQLCAVVLSRLDTRTAAQIIEELDPDLQKATVARLMSSKPLSANVIAMVEKRLDEAFKLSNPSSGSKRGEMQLAEILMEMGKGVSDDILDSLGPVIGEKKVAGVRAKLFRFDDVASLSQESRTLLCDGLSSEILTAALRDAEVDVKEAVLSAIGQRSRRMIESELTDGRKVNVKEVEQARKSIAALALRMASEGKIEIQTAEAA